MKSNRDMLTNEKLKSRFPSQFDLVNHAIKLAEDMIATGRVSHFRLDGQNNNVALQILEEVSLPDSHLLKKP